MISSNCISVIRMELNKLGYHRFLLSTGELDVNDHLMMSDRERLKASLSIQGYTLLDEENSKLIEDVKKTIMQDIFFSRKTPCSSYNNLLSRRTGQKYELINNLFTEIIGVTIERYAIQLKIERAKELLVDHNLSIPNVAKKAGFYNTSNLVNHFKKNVGITPNQFKSIKTKVNHILPEEE